MRIEIYVDLSEPVDPDNPTGFATLIQKHIAPPMRTPGYMRIKVVADVPGYEPAPVVEGRVEENDDAKPAR